MPDEKIIQCHRSSFGSIAEIEESACTHVDISEPLNFADGSEPPQSIATRVGMEWNETGLFIFFRGLFNQLRLPPPDPYTAVSSKSHKLWEQSDVYEVFIGPNAKSNKCYKEFQVSPDSRWIDIDVNRQLNISNEYWYSGMRCKSIIDNEMQIWTSFIELPWNCFGSQRKQEDHWNVNFYRASGKFHGDELLAWAVTGYGGNCFHRPEHFGSIEFVK